MKLQLLPSSFEAQGTASRRQHLACFIIDDCVALDAGSLALAANDTQRENVRDIVLTHAHLDHIAGLPLFVDDLFAALEEPIVVHATAPVVEIMERDIFNWDVYPRFSELENDAGSVLRYKVFAAGDEFSVRHLRFKSIAVNHKVPTVGFVIGDGAAKIAFTGDTAEMDAFWEIVNAEENLSALLIECAFPDELESLARASHHLTPTLLRAELDKFERRECPVYVINIKPMYCETVSRQIKNLGAENLEILRVGEVYQW